MRYEITGDKTGLHFDDDEVCFICQKFGGMCSIINDIRTKMNKSSYNGKSMADCEMFTMNIGFNMQSEFKGEPQVIAGDVKDLNQLRKRYNDKELGMPPGEFDQHATVEEQHNQEQ